MTTRVLVTYPTGVDGLVAFAAYPGVDETATREQLREALAWIETGDPEVRIGQTWLDESDTRALIAALERADARLAEADESAS